MKKRKVTKEKEKQAKIELLMKKKAEDLGLRHFSEQVPVKKASQANESALKDISNNTT